MNAATSMNQPLREIVVFAKYPEPGRVKTRLIGAIGAEAATELHRRCLRLTIDCVCSVEDALARVAISPDDADFSAFIEIARVIPQGDGDLGERLGRVTQQRFADGCERLLLVGSDCPTLAPSDLRAAFDALDSHDAVIGPALDGGYYLLGMRRPEVSLFAGVDWSTDRVAAQTRDKAVAAGLTIEELPARRDIDTFEDLVSAYDSIVDDDERLAPFKRFLGGLVNRHTEDRDASDR